MFISPKKSFWALLTFSWESCVWFVKLSSDCLINWPWTSSVPILSPFLLAHANESRANKHATPAVAREQLIICQRPLWSLSWVHFILSLGLRHHITHGIWQKPQQIEKIKINFYSWTFRSYLRSLKRPSFLLDASWVSPRCAGWYSKGSCHSMLGKQHG